MIFLLAIRKPLSVFYENQIIPETLPRYFLAIAKYGRSIDVNRP